MRTNWSAKDPVRAERIPPRRLSDLARRAKRGRLAALVIFGLVAGGLIAGVPFVPAVYRSSAVLMITSREGDIALTTPADAATRSALVDEGVETLNSPAMAERIAAELRQKAPDQAAAVASRSGAKDLRDLVKARRRGESYLVDVEATAPTPQSAKAVVEAAIEAFQFRQLDQRFGAVRADLAAGQPAATAAPPAADPRAELARLEAEKAELLAAAPKPAAPHDSRAQAELAEARNDAAAMKALLRSEVTSEDVARYRASGAIDRLGESEAGFAVDLLGYETAMGAAKDDPSKADDVKFRKYQILTAASKLQPALEERVSRLAAAASATPAEAAPSSTPTAETAARLTALDLQIEAQRKLAEAPPASQPAPRTVAAPATLDTDVRVVSQPALGVTAVWRQPLILYSAAVGIALLLSLAYLVFTTLASNTVTDPRDAAALAGAPLVASVPRITAAQLRSLPPSDRHPANFPIENPASLFADAMRAALASIASPGVRSEAICIAVAGAQAGDGASTISLALARTAASSGIRVLLIDTDFETAGLTKAMNIEPAAGIEAILGGDRQLMDLVVEDDLTSVHLLPSAPSESSRGALSLTQLNALKAALAGAKSAYEMIIIDCQPHSSRARTRSMARMADIALIVASYDVTRRELLSAVARRTQQNGAKVCGVVFNLAPDQVRRENVDFVAEHHAATTAPLFAQSASSDVEVVRSIH